MLAQILDAVARLVGEFAEVDLVGVARAGEHADVGAGAEHARLSRAQHHHPDLRVLEAQPLDGVSELDVDAEVVGVQLEVVALEQRALLVHVEEERGHVAVDVELPMAVARRLGLEIEIRVWPLARGRSAACCASVIAPSSTTSVAGAVL